MPTYEMAVILRRLSKPEQAKILKRAAQYVFDKEGVLFGLENLGTRRLPFRMSSGSGKKVHEGSYFLFKFDAPSASVKDLSGECSRDIDIVRAGITRAILNEKKEKYECTLEEELRPPAYRKDVQEMIAKSRTKERRFDPGTNLDYNPIRL